MKTSSEKKRDTLVLASGVFDLVHYGHVHFLQEAKKVGGPTSRLIVIIARDKTVENLKGKPPILPEEQRRAIVAALKPVDKAVLGREDFDMEEILRDISPDVVAVGYDQKAVEERVRAVVEKKALNIRIERIGKFLASDLDSSSKIRSKILGQHQTTLPVAG